MSLGWLASSIRRANEFTGAGDNGSEMPNHCQNGNGSFAGTTRWGAYQSELRLSSEA